MIARCGLGYCPRTERKIPSVPSIFSTIPMKPKSGKNHSQSQEPRKSAQDVENDFHDHAFSFGREPGIPRREIGDRLKRTRIHVAFSVFFDCFGIFLWIGFLTYVLTCLLCPGDQNGRDDVRQQRLECFHSTMDRSCVNIYSSS